MTDSTDDVDWYDGDDEFEDDDDLCCDECGYDITECTCDSDEWDEDYFDSDTFQEDEDE